MTGKTVESMLDYDRNSIRLVDLGPNCCIIMSELNLKKANEVNESYFLFNAVTRQESFI